MSDLKKKKILFFHFDLQGGGAEKVLMNLLRHINQDKYDTTLYTILGAGPNLKNIPRGIKFKALFHHIIRGTSQILKLFSPTCLHKLLIRGQYDIEIAYIEGTPTRIVSGANGKTCKKVAWIHCQLMSPGNLACGMRSVEEATNCYNQLDRIICVSKTVKESFLKFYPAVTTPVEVIYNVNDYNLIQSLSKENINLTLDPNTLNICMVGRLVGQKRHDRVIEALARIIQKGADPMIHFYIIGDGPERASLSKMMTEKNVESYFTFVGYQDNPYKWMSKMDFLLSTSHKEGFSTVASEASSLNIPIVTTDVSGMDEILNYGEYGLIVNNSTEGVENGLYTIINNPSMIEAFRDRLIKRPKPNTEIMVKQYEDFLDSL